MTSDLGGNLGESVAGCMKDEPALELYSQVADSALDIELPETLLAKIPIASVLVAATKIGRSVADRLLLRKVARFLFELRGKTPQERRDMVDKLENDPAYGRRVGEHVMELMERIDSHRKPSMAAKVFLAHLDQRISTRDLNRLLLAVERIPVHEIDTVRAFVNSANNQPERDKIDEESVLIIAAAGLATGQSGWGSIVYKHSRTASLFLDLNLDVVD